MAAKRAAPPRALAQQAPPRLGGCPQARARRAPKQGPDARHKQGKITDGGPNMVQFGGVGGTNHEAAITDLVPLGGHPTGNVEVKGLAVDVERLEVAAARVAGATEHEHPAVGVAQERLDLSLIHISEPTRPY